MVIKWADCIENAQNVTSVRCIWPISIFLANSAYELWPMAFLLDSYWSIISGNRILIGQCVTWCQHCNQVFFSAQYITKLQGHMTFILLFLQKLFNGLIYFEYLNIWIMESLYNIGTLRCLNIKYALSFIGNLHVLTFSILSFFDLLIIQMRG